MLQADPRYPNGVLSLMEKLRKQGSPFQNLKPGVGPLGLAKPDGSAAFNAAFAGVGEPSSQPKPPVPVETVDTNTVSLPEAPPIDAELPDVKRGGVFDRIGDFIGSDSGKGALFRAGATMLSTGDVGRGMLAGAGHIDDLKASEAAAAQQAFLNEQRERTTDINQQRADTDAILGSERIGVTREGNMLDYMLGNQRDRTARRGQDVTRSGYESRERTAAADRGSRERIVMAQIEGRRQLAQVQSQLAEARAANDFQRQQYLLGMETRIKAGLADLNRYDEETTYQYDEDGNKIGERTSKIPSQ